jgi:hypothetical protein
MFDFPFYPSQSFVSLPADSGSSRLKERPRIKTLGAVSATRK